MQTPWPAEELVEVRKCGEEPVKVERKSLVSASNSLRRKAKSCLWFMRARHSDGSTSFLLCVPSQLLAFARHARMARQKQAGGGAQRNLLVFTVSLCHKVWEIGRRFSVLLPLPRQKRGTLNLPCGTTHWRLHSKARSSRLSFNAIKGSQSFWTGRMARLPCADSKSNVLVINRGIGLLIFFAILSDRSLFVVAARSGRE
jgi:hypothetical protein